MCKKIVLLLITTLLLAVSADAAGKKFTLVVDAGHGGRDTGAKGRQTMEKTLTLRIALAFGKLVEQNCPDVNVVYTRKTDRFVELYRRAEIANQNKADLFISIHINALPKGKTARGFQTYTLGTSKRTGKKTGVVENLEVAKRENAVIFLEKDYKQTYHGYDPNSPESNIMFEFVQDKNMENSVELARYMQRYVCRATGRRDMGAQQDNLAVLRLTSMPGCLIELGFISTRDEEQYMNSSIATAAYARGIYNAFAAYKQRHGGQINVPFMAEPTSKKVEIPQIVPKQSERQARREEQPKAAERQPEPMQPAAPEAKAEETAQRPTSASADASQQDIDLSVVRDDASAKRQEAAPRQQETSAKRQETTPSEGRDAADAPVFKVQVGTGTSPLKAGDKRFKGLQDMGCFKEKGIYKYTVGASTNYNEIYRLRKSILARFPEAFIIAFRQDQKMDVQEALREFRNRKK